MVLIYSLGENGRYMHVETRVEPVERAVKLAEITDANAREKSGELIRLLSEGQTSLADDTFRIFTPTSEVRSDFSSSQPYSDGVLALFSYLRRYGEDRHAEGVLIDSADFIVDGPARTLKCNACGIRRVK
jgi:hypothetical protein